MAILEKSCHVAEVTCVQEAYTVSPASNTFYRLGCALPNLLHPPSTKVNKTRVC